MAQKQNGNGLYPIRVAAELLGLHPQTLRLYDHEGILCPERQPNTQQRLYSDQDLRWARCIRHLIHHEGLTAPGIRRLMELQPCHAICRCSSEEREVCWSHLRPSPDVPAFQVYGPQRGVAAEDVGTSAPEQSNGQAEFWLFYGVREFGAILPCEKCVRAERSLRKVAARYGDRVLVTKHDVLSPEADRFGVMLTPTIVLNTRVVAMGRSLSERRLEELLRREGIVSQGEMR